VSELGELRFDADLTEIAQAGERAAAGEQHVVSGRVTRCGQPVSGRRVVAFLDLTLGIETDWRPCLRTSSTRQLGTASTDADGAYLITYAAPPGPEAFCAYSAAVRVDVYEGTTRVAHTTARTAHASVRVDVELFPGCTAGSTPIVVLDGSNQRVRGAEVFVNGSLAGTTDTQGALAVPTLAVNDVLVARKLVQEHESGRGEHSTGGADWSHRTYITSLQVRHDASGDNVELRQNRVTDPSATQELRLSTRNTLVGFNLVCSIEWDATSDDGRRYTDRLTEMSELMFNATDGQFLVERLAVYDSGRGWSEADIRIYASHKAGSHADFGGVFSSGGYIYMNPTDAHEPSVFLHELGHYAFDVKDEYKAGFLWEESDGEPACTKASLGSGVFGEGGTKESCLLRGAVNAEVKKICSSHPANPHTTYTAQGLRNCWSVILDRYGDPRWRLLDPPGRGAIVDVLPDSGVPLAATTVHTAGVGPVASYIPVRAWKPTRFRSIVHRAGECPNRLVQVLLNGSRVNDVKVWLRSAGRTLYQGTTEPKLLAYNQQTRDGEIRLRGAHVGDSVLAFHPVLPSAYGTGDIDDCGPEALVVTLLPLRSFAAGAARLQPLAPGELTVRLEPAGASAHAVVFVEGAAPISLPLAEARDPADAAVRGFLRGLPPSGRLTVELTVLDDQGNEIALPSEAVFASTVDEEALTVCSADGRAELVLPAGALAAPLQILIETELVPSVAPPDRWQLVGDAYRISSSGGDALARRAWLSFELDGPGRPRGGRKLQHPTIVTLDETGAWQPLPRQTVGERHVAALVERLGAVALMEAPARR
jgi:hypothetical protein